MYQPCLKQTGLVPNYLTENKVFFNELSVL